MPDRPVPHLALPLFFVVLASLAGCGRDAAQAAAGAQPPLVRTVAPQPLGAASLVLSGVVRARHETPLAFQVGGRLVERRVDAGDAVPRGATLMAIDLADLNAARAAADADRAAARAALALAKADRARADGLVARGFLSGQGAERAALVEREAATRLAAAESRFEQAANAVGYGALRAPAAGVLAEVTVEPGQVVAPGQSVATLAHEGAREVEVQLPDGVVVPKTGELQAVGSPPLRLALRELAGAADARSRTWRARYRVTGSAAPLRLGSVHRVVLAQGDGNTTLWQVPLGALDERGAGARLWIIEADKAVPRPVELVGIAGEAATVRASLPAGTRVIALGTHLLQPGMAVREQAR